MNVRYRVLDSRTTVGANEVYTAPNNSERIGFLLMGNGGTINYKPSSIAGGISFATFSTGATVPFRPITVAEHGNMILEPWTFTMVNLGNSYAIIELYTPKDFKNEVLV